VVALFAVGAAAPGWPGPWRATDVPAGTFELGGPDTMSMDDFVRGLNGGEVRLLHLPPVVARGLAHVLPSLTPALMDLLLADSVPTADPSAVARRVRALVPPVAGVWASPSGRAAPPALEDPRRTPTHARRRPWGVSV